MRTRPQYTEREANAVFAFAYGCGAACVKSEALPLGEAVAFGVVLVVFMFASLEGFDWLSWRVSRGGAA